MTDQRSIYSAVVARGYRAGWTPVQFAARQLAKLAEELGEASLCVELSGELAGLIAAAGDQGRRTFDNRGHFCWQTADIDDINHLRAELADMLVVIMTLGETLNEIDGRQTDLMQAAVEKALNDIGRGVR